MPANPISVQRLFSLTGWIFGPRACPNRALQQWTARLRVREKTRRTGSSEKIEDCHVARAFLRAVSPFLATLFVPSINPSRRHIESMKFSAAVDCPHHFFTASRPKRRAYARLGSFPSLLWLTVIAGFAVTFGSLRAAEPTPQRIVSSAPSITEMLYALGLGDRVVGVTTFCHYPPEVLKKPKIGTYMNPNFEVILGKKPDLVIVLKEHRRLGTKLKNFGLPVLALQHNTLKEIYESMLALGERTGAEQAAQQRVAVMRKQLDEIGALAAPLPKRSVMFVVGRTPATVRDLVVVGRGSFLNELISIAGGTNCFEDAPAFYPRIPREEVYARGPEVIIDMGDMGDTQQVSEEYRRSIVEVWKSQAMLPAVQAERVYAVAEDFFMVPGPRVVEATRSLLAMIHPEVVR